MSLTNKEELLNKENEEHLLKIGEVAAFFSDISESGTSLRKERDY